ncbi:MAG: hypothetical protein FWG09_04930, partial [Synergistaceae bacterium]|nr:hypothetical protein [Synergistaceae bacterium]
RSEAGARSEVRGAALNEHMDVNLSGRKQKTSFERKALNSSDSTISLPFFLLYILTSPLSYGKIPEKPDKRKRSISVWQNN